MRTRAASLILLTILGSGIHSFFPAVSLAEQKESPTALTEARRGLIDYVQFFTNRIERASGVVADATDDIRIKRNTVYFKIRVVPIARQALDRADDQAAMMDLWLQVSLLNRFLGSQESAEYFGKGLPTMASAVDDLVVAAQALAKSVLTPEQFASAGDAIQSFVAQRDINQHFSPMADSSAQAEWSSVVTSTLDKPLSVVSASFSMLPFGGGISDTAVAVHQVAGEASRVTALIRYLPTEVRWQFELLLLDAVDYMQVGSIVASLDSASKSAASLSETAAALPTTVETIFEEIDGRQEQIQVSLREANTVMTSVDRAATTLTGTSRALTETLTALDSAMVTILGPPEVRAAEAASTEESDARPFDITEYTAAAAEFTGTATALTALLGEVESIEDSSAVQGLLERVERLVTMLVVKLVMAAAVLVVFTAIVMLAYQAAMTKLGLRPGGKAGQA